ncbi:polar amino acid transport system substrate-binding protein [Paucibacter oligotrophus]|uniref:Polar amino acid transport system substrate-binding protein n=1 Tax=Roseateles oligotrophus TaxID=1769250 RepID=A0A840LJX2_9BURK|nr:transporter substrate-binding domain-containing protein [Roseateles oligotrophus]MBB4845587.1 polar amino acid transport system substrate-binding protein [Roseateles oligotrophus]
MPCRREFQHLLLGLLGSPLLAGAAESQQGQGVLQGFTHELPPLSHQDTGGLSGLFIELLREMLPRLNLQINLEMQPLLRAQQSLSENPLGLLFPYARMAERESLYRWVGPVLPRRVLIYRLAQRRDIRFQDLQHLNGLRLGAKKGTATLSQLQALGLRVGKELELGSDYLGVLRMLLAQRMELMVMNDTAALWSLQQLQLPPDTLKVVGEFDRSTSYWFALNPNGPPWLAQSLQQTLDGLRAQGRLEALRTKYGL